MADPPNDPDPLMPDADEGPGRRPSPERARLTRELQVLRRASEAINSSLDLDDIYESALQTMGELFEFHHAIVLLLESGGTTLRVVASRGYEHQATGGRVAVGAGVIGLAAQRRKPLYVGHLGQHRVYAAAQRRQLMKAGRGGELGDTAPVSGLTNAESHLAIPLLVRDELIGVFSIESPVRRTISEHERGLVSIVANQIASAIHNARLYEERATTAAALQEANASLEARVTERTAALERELRVAEELLNDARSRVEGPLLGESAAVQRLRDDIAREAQRREPLLIAGPPGAGHEAVAHAIHEASGRPGAFIVVSCPEMHSVVAPAVARVPGGSDRRLLAAKFDVAAGGTLFLDAIHELPAELQHELVERLGRRGGSDAPPDVRVIASTTRDLASDLRIGTHETLLGVLSRYRIAVPALADRREDIPPIVRHFVLRLARQMGKTVTAVSTESMSRLEAYLWPGNIRELRTVLERAIVVARSSVLEIEEDLLDEGQAVGSYRLVSPLGSGGMGEVWLARHRLLARPAAVKLIRHDAPHGLPHDRLVRRFQREAQVTANLRSPHTVQLYDFGINDSGAFFYVMELLHGLDLHRIVARFGPQPAERVVMLLRQACRSLAEAHGHGLVHRDIKPANLFVTCLGSEYDYLKVVDFGIVREQPGQEATHLSAQNLLQGTPAFMAPEIVLGERIDGRADLYSLACSAYFALTGQLLFQAATPAQMILHHAQTRPVPLSEVSELPVPRALGDLVMTCLEKNPGARVASALEFDERLSQVPLATSWTDDTARDWWEAHAPEVLAQVHRLEDGPQ